MPRSKSTPSKRSLSLTQTSWIFSKHPPLPESLTQENVVQMRETERKSDSAIMRLSFFHANISKETGLLDPTDTILGSNSLSASPPSYTTLFEEKGKSDTRVEDYSPHIYSKTIEKTSHPGDMTQSELLPSMESNCDGISNIELDEEDNSSILPVEDASGFHTPPIFGSFEQFSQANCALGVSSLNIATKKLDQLEKASKRKSMPILYSRSGDDPFDVSLDTYNSGYQTPPQFENKVTEGLNDSSSTEYVDSPVTPSESNHNPNEMSREQQKERNLEKFQNSNSDEKTYQIGQEILSSERTYVKGLLMIQKVFLCPLLESLATANPILPRNSLTRIFSNILDIVNLNKELLKQLEEQVADASPNMIAAKIAKIFLDISPFLKMYSMYARNFSNSISTVSTHSNQNSSFAKFIAKANKRPECGSLRFESHLILPVQRIPRYEMLLKQLIKSIGENHPDHGSLSKALLYVEDVAKYVNEMIRAGEKSIIMVHIQKSLTGFSENLFIPGRTFIHQGSAKKICRKSHQIRKFFLFSDILIYASPSLVGDSHSFKRKLSLRELHVSDVPDEEGEPSNRFKISSREKSFVLYVEKPEQKEEWINLVQTAIQNLQGSIVPNQGVSPSNMTAEFKEHLANTIHKQQCQIMEPAVIKDYYSPVWVPDSEASKCACCNELFNPVTRRKHHCRLCGKVVCHGCSSKRFMIPGIYGENSRVERSCDPCYDLKFGHQTPSMLVTMAPALPVAKNKRILELANDSKDPENRRHSCTADSARTKREERRGSLIDSIRSQRTRAMTMLESGLRASFYGGSTPILTFALKKKCDLCLEEFSIFRWRNDCGKCKRTICFDCLSKQTTRSSPTSPCKPEIHTYEQKIDENFVNMSPGMFEDYFDEITKICDPCSRDIPPSQVKVNEQGGGWSIIALKSPEIERDGGQFGYFGSFTSTHTNG
ncbi:hypothetical protein K7432_005548 [Basidiobolus ranarum]|uniref:Uncharacterized protein n=1 Tax=Basidiobolus ranarum TaxID=34480 RepID=A0ABR2W340_9FUNG